MKKCSYCAEEIQDETIKCKHCGELLKKVEPETLEALDKIKDHSGCFSALLSFCIPGLAQLMLGQYGLAITYIVLAIAIGIPTYGIGALFLGIISAIHAATTSIYRCPKCREKVEYKATICKYCHIKLK